MLLQQVRSSNFRRFRIRAIRSTASPRLSTKARIVRPTSLRVQLPRQPLRRLQRQPHQQLPRQLRQRRRRRRQSRVSLVEVNTGCRATTAATRKRRPRRRRTRRKILQRITDSKRFRLPRLWRGRPLWPSVGSRPSGRAAVSLKKSRPQFSSVFLICFFLQERNRPEFEASFNFFSIFSRFFKIISPEFLSAKIFDASMDWLHRCRCRRCRSCCCPCRCYCMLFFSSQNKFHRRTDF